LIFITSLVNSEHKLNSKKTGISVALEFTALKMCLREQVQRGRIQEHHSPLISLSTTIKQFVLNKKKVKNLKWIVSQFRKI